MEVTLNTLLYILKCTFDRMNFFFMAASVERHFRTYFSQVISLTLLFCGHLKLGGYRRGRWLCMNFYRENTHVL